MTSTTVYHFTRGLVVAGVLASSLQAVRADVAFTGDYDYSIYPDYSSVAVGLTAVGGVTIDAGSTLNTSLATLGRDAGGSGTGLVTGAGSQWQNFYTIYIGEWGNGQLTVNNGGAFQTNASIQLGEKPGTAGYVFVDGQGSLLKAKNTIHIGSVGHGELHVSNGAAVNSKSAIVGHGFAELSGPGTTWTVTENITVGWNGDSSLRILNGAVVKAATGIIRNGNNDSVVISGQGSQLNLSGSMTVGDGYAGSMVVEQGGSIISGAASLSSLWKIPVHVIVRGQGSSWVNNGPLNITPTNADMGVSIEDGATLVTGTTTVGNGLNYENNPYLNVSGSGSTLTVNGTLTIQPRSKFVVDQGASASATSVYASLDDLYGNGTIHAKGAVLDLDFVADATHDLTHTAYFGTGGTLLMSHDGTGDLGAGFNGKGSIQIRDGRKVTSAKGTLGWTASSEGSALVRGAGSTWTNSAELTVGYYGRGALVIDEGASVKSASAYVAKYGKNSNGSVHISGPGSSWAVSGNAYLGYQGVASVVIDNGGVLSTTDLTMGYSRFAGGTNVLVEGPGSKLTATGKLYIGYAGDTTVRVQNGGQVSGGTVYLGVRDPDFSPIGGGSTTVGLLPSSVHVTGSGSVFTATYLGIGGYFPASMVVSDHGQLNAKYFGIGTDSLLQLNVSNNDMLVMNTFYPVNPSNHQVSFGGTLRLVAAPQLQAGNYTPIKDESTWPWTFVGPGTVQGFGGTWNSTTNVFTVGALQEVAAGSAWSLSTGDRLRITDSASGQAIFASFGTMPSPASFSATLMQNEQLSQLLELSGGNPVLSAWDFDTSLTSDQMVQLSIQLGDQQDGIQIWHLSQGLWSLYSPRMMDIDSNGFLTLDVNGFSGYAVTVVPEPSSVSVLGLVAVIFWKRRRSTNPLR